VSLPYGLKHDLKVVEPVHDASDKSFISFHFISFHAGTAFDEISHSSLAFSFSILNDRMGKYAQFVHRSLNYLL
jgi:hypothetical protein